MPYGKVLVVDDVESNLYVANGLMKPYMLQIDTVMSGSEAIGKIESGTVYDIIFMDHMMPDMDGVETTARLRESGYTHPIVALTANVIEGQPEMFLRSGFDDFISKPIDIQRLNTILNKFIRDKQPPEVIEAAILQAAEAKNKAASEGQSSTELQAGSDSLLIESFVRDVHRAIDILDELSREGRFESDEGLKKYTITVHGMKSSLWNVGEAGLSGTAAMLEQAGREDNTGLIFEATPGFISQLRTLTEKYELKREDGGSDGDVKALCDKLLVIEEKCADYDRKGALNAIAEVTSCSDETRAVLDKVKENVLSSDFEEAESEVSAYREKLL